MSEYTYKQIEKKANKLTYEVVVNYSFYQNFEDKAFKEESSTIKMPGFRPGKAPKDLVEKEIASKVFSKAINSLLPEVALKVLTEEKLSPLSNLDYSLKEFDKEKGVIFTFTLFEQPKIDIEKLKKLNIEFEKAEIKEEEIDDVIQNMVKQKNKPHDHSHEDHDHGDHDHHDHEHEEGHDHNHEHESEEDKKQEKIEVTDEMVKSLGYEDAKTLDELRKKIRDTLLGFKEQQNESIFSQKAIDEAVKSIEFELPEEMIETEAARQEEDFLGRLKKIKLDVDNYLNTQGTTLEKLREDWKKEAKDQIASDLLLINLAIQEKLVPSEEEVDKEIANISDVKVQAQYRDPKNKDYLRTLMTRDRGLKRLIDLTKKAA